VAHRERDTTATATTALAAPRGSSEELGPSAGEPMANIQPGEPAGMPLARARVFGALFGEHSTVGTFGRFRVLERLGAGGMGVVYEAYDPDLARGVALKLVDVATRDREPALAEAKALARLSHPNVVPIYDVGVEGHHVYLVMELVRGKTLRGWVVDRTPTEILAVYQQAGAALAAAHEVGLVHRDFKPENAIVGADGRVRVVDFGLACEADDPAHAPSEPRQVAGTPRFMAPEIKTGSAITPAADQYSYCVALAEALDHARGPVPRRIGVVLQRGRAVNPADRFASMTELTRALARDPARTRRRLAAAGGMAGALASVAFLLGRHSPSGADACDQGAAQLDAAWSPAARSAALDRVATLDSYGRSLRPQLERDLDTHRRSWLQEYRAACADHRRGTDSDALIDRRTTCLRRGSDALATVAELVGHAEAASLTELPRAVQSMPDPAACSDRAALASDIAPPAPALATPVAQVRREITQVRILIGAGRYGRAEAEAGRAVADARRLGYAPVLAEALLVQGHAQMSLPARIAALPFLTEATTVAMASRDDALAVEAWARRAWVLGIETAPDGALAGFDVIEPLANRTASATFARALLYNNIGTVELARDHRDQARGYFDRALAVSRTTTGRGALELIVIRINLALVTDDRARADKLLADAAAELADRLEPEHPNALEARRLRAFSTIDNLHDAEQLLVPVCRSYALHPGFAEVIADCWTEVGLLRWDLGDRTGATEAMALAVGASPEAPLTVAYLALLRGQAQAAARRFAEAQARAPSELPWQRLERGHLSLGLGRARREAGDLRGALAAFEAAISDLEPVVRVHPNADWERRLGRARVELAFTLADLGASEQERAAVATPAAAWLRAVGGMPSEIAQLRVR